MAFYASRFGDAGFSTANDSSAGTESIPDESRYNFERGMRKETIVEGSALANS